MQSRTYFLSHVQETRTEKLLCGDGISDQVMKYGSEQFAVKKNKMQSAQPMISEIMNTFIVQFQFGSL